MFTLFMAATAVATTAAKWVIVGKILTVVGGGILTVAPAIEQMIDSEKEIKEW